MCSEIGELCLHIGAMELALDQFLFASAEAYGKNLGARIKKFPWTREGKFEAFCVIYSEFLSSHPSLPPLSSGSLDDMKGWICEISECRNFISHGAVVDIAGNGIGYTFGKYERDDGEASNKSYRYNELELSSMRLRSLISKSQKITFLIDQCSNHVGYDTDGWNTVLIHRRRSMISWELARSLRSLDSRSSIAPLNGLEGTQ